MQILAAAAAAGALLFISAFIMKTFVLELSWKQLCRRFLSGKVSEAVLFFVFYFPSKQEFRLVGGEEK